MKSDKNSTTAAVYIRWSTDDQGTGTTQEEQRETCLRWAGEKGLAVFPEHVFIDDGVSGAKVDRPALNRLNRLIQAGAIGLVIVYKLDRLARRPYIAYKLVEEWRGKASLVSVTEAHIDTTTTVGELGFGIATVFAAHERNTIRDRTLSGKRRRAAEGRNPGLRPPFGYAMEGKQFIINESEAAIVRRIYGDYLAGRTDGQIASVLCDTGVRTRQGGYWYVSAVQRILQNPAYKGTLVYRDITAENGFPVIIDDEKWGEVQALRRQKAGSHPRRMASESPYILSGRLVCGGCGRPMNGRVCRKDGKYESRYYACTGSIQFRNCACLSVRQDPVEQAVMAHLLPLLDEGEYNRRVAAQVGQTMDQLHQEIAALDAQLRRVEQEVARVRQDYRRGKIDADTFNELRAEIESDRAALAAALSARKTERIAAEADSKLGEEIRVGVTLLRAWNDLSFTQRKQVIHLLVKQITWDFRSKAAAVETVI